MEKSTIQLLAWPSSRQVAELAAGKSTVMLDLTREMTDIDHTPLMTTKLHIESELLPHAPLKERGVRQELILKVNSLSKKARLKK